MLIAVRTRIRNGFVTRARLVSRARACLWLQTPVNSPARARDASPSRRTRREYDRAHEHRHRRAARGLVDALHGGPARGVPSAVDDGGGRILHRPRIPRSGGAAADAAAAGAAAVAARARA